ncbi:MAG: hypothetical protein LBR31_08870 [Desulfovibrio sp.]|jgi:hypothetical protein|nr:hypothetical protein [Desulfovibrio sp.]
MKKLFVVFLIAFLGFSLPGCAWLGRTTGKAKAKMERKVDDIDRAYHQGYSEEKRKTSENSASRSDAKQVPEEDPATSSEEQQQKQQKDVETTTSI